MQPNKLGSAMVRMAVEKGIRDVKQHPERGMRNLLELGDMFSGEGAQKQFFSAARRQLENKNSPYTKLIERLITDTDTDILLNFGMNLGYNALSHGAKAIRDTESREGFNIPWTLIFELGLGQDLTPGEIEDVVRQGLELGAYCYFYFISPTYAETAKLLTALARLDSCAHIVCVRPGTVDADFAEAVLKAKNILPAVLIDGEESHAARAVGELKSRGCLFAGYSVKAEPANGLAPPATLDRAQRLGATFYLLVRNGWRDNPEPDEVYRGISRLRENLTLPVFPFDLYHDIAEVDRTISSEACLAFIGEGGGLDLINADRGTRHRGQSVRSSSLRDALEAAMPKREAR